MPAVGSHDIGPKDGKGGHLVFSFQPFEKIRLDHQGIVVDQDDPVGIQLMFGISIASIVPLGKTEVFRQRYEMDPFVATIALLQGFLATVG